MTWSSSPASNHLPFLHRSDDCVFYSCVLMNHTCQCVCRLLMTTILLSAINYSRDCRYINQALEGLLALIRDHCLVWTPSNQSERERETEASRVSLSASFVFFLLQLCVSTLVISREIKESPPATFFGFFFNLSKAISHLHPFILLFSSPQNTISHLLIMMQRRAELLQKRDNAAI